MCADQRADDIAHGSAPHRPAASPAAVPVAAPVVRVWRGSLQRIQPWAQRESVAADCASQMPGKRAGFVIRQIEVMLDHVGVLRMALQAR
jgi:hypothetical protein